MSKSTISTFQLFELVPDAETARVWFESRLWPNGPRCPVCGLGERNLEDRIDAAWTRSRLGHERAWYDY